MGINEAAEAIEKFLLTYDGGSGKPATVRAHPSGDDVDVIKVHVELGSGKGDMHAWEKAAAAAIHEALPDAQAFRLQIRAETTD